MLKKFRQKIDKIDAKIAKYLCKRYENVKEIAEIKRKSDIPVYDKEREEELIHNISSCCDSDSDCKDYIHKVFEDIYKNSRDIQK